MNKIIYIIIPFITIVNSAIAQVDDTTLHRYEINLKDYLEKVSNKNLDYASQKFNVNIADAKIEQSKVFQNPAMSFDLTQSNGNYNVSGYSYYTLGFSKSIDIGQKRKTRIDLAKSQYLITKAMLSDYFRNLRADATIDYLTALKQSLLFNAKQNSYQLMKDLADADSIRLGLGSITSIDATQTKIEAGTLWNEFIQSETDRNNAFLQLSVNVSSFSKDTLYMPKGNFNNVKRNFVLNNLITIALNNRADLQAALGNIDVSKNTLKLTKRERISDIGLNIATNDYYLSRFTATSATAITGGISIPLQFSNIYRGDIKAAQYQVQQAELNYRQAEIRIQNEIIQAFNQYMTLLRQVENYNNGLIEQSKAVLNGKTYSYSRGETSLLEVLDAQRTYNDIQTSYCETMYNCYAALVELERAAGIWDIDL